MLEAKDIRGVVGIMPTPATNDAGSWQTAHSVNIRESARMTRLLVDAGVDILMTTGTFGECASLTWEELHEFVRCVVETAAGRVPVFAGVTTLNTRDTISRARELVRLGADGLFVGRPMWLPLDDSGIVKFYRHLTEALPGVPLVVYDNPAAFKGKISQDVYRELARLPEIVAAKHVGGPELEPDLLAVGDHLTLLPLEKDWCELAEKHPQLAIACWSGNVACAPAPIVALGHAIGARDWPRARELTCKIRWAMEPMFPGGELAQFMPYSIQLGHVRFAEAGLVRPGPPRPPYTEVPTEFVAGSKECGRRWAKLQNEFQHVAAGKAAAR